jgi:hypothetical protein
MIHHSSWIRVLSIAALGGAFALVGPMAHAQSVTAAEDDAEVTEESFDEPAEGDVVAEGEVHHVSAGVSRHGTTVRGEARMRNDDGFFKSACVVILKDGQAGGRPFACVDLGSTRAIHGQTLVANPVPLHCIADGTKHTYVTEVKMDPPDFSGHAGIFGPFGFSRKLRTNQNCF